ncbi:MAG: hypothetical protein KBA30_00895 [Clostridia bacterium]|nr:hypothetical protein [Clostridia bacterium]
MKCPYCGESMEKGLISSNHEIAWLPGEKRKLFGRADFHPGAVALSEVSFLKGSAVTAYICKKCEKVVIDYSDSKSDFNKG